MQSVKMRPSLPRQRLIFRLRWLFDSPLLMAVWACVTVAAVVASRVATVAHDVACTQYQLRSTLADLAAESAAMRAVAADHPNAPGVEHIGSARCTVSAPAEAVTPQCVVVELPGQRTRTYVFDVLPGGSPPALGIPFAYAGGRLPPLLLRQAVALPAAAMPQVSSDIERLAAPPTMTGAIAADDSVALLRLPAGTDRPDFVLGRSGDEITVRVPDGGTVLVDGNLWVDAGNQPLELVLTGDLTILVRGNVYLGRSVAVRGGGRLLLVALAAPGLAFRDLDDNCRWSPGDDLLAPSRPPYRGPQEGSGSVWIGFAKVRPETMYFDLGFVVQGELHLAVDQARAFGPVLLHHGCTLAAGARGSLAVTAEHLPQVDRELVPGFVTNGPPRPGLLRRVEDDGQTLYPASSAR